MTSGSDASTSAPPPSEAAALVFVDMLDLAARYAELLARDAVPRGLIGPREVPRLWERHLVNSALVSDLLPVGATVVDVGSGAGLPGIPIAIRRPDLHVVLVEPMLRRTAFLGEVVTTLGLADRVRVVRGRAEDRATRAEVGAAEWVTARAVAPLDRLVGWCLPMVVPGGQVLALKGSTAQSEVDEHAVALRRSGVGAIAVHELGTELPVEPTWAVSLERAARTERPRGARRDGARSTGRTR